MKKLLIRLLIVLVFPVMILLYFTVLFFTIILAVPLNVIEFIFKGKLIILPFEYIDACEKYYRKIINYLKKKKILYESNT